MDDQRDEAAEDLATLTADQKIELEYRIAGWQDVVGALRLLAGRPYFSPEQAAMILAEADELEEKDIEPMRAALRDTPMSEILWAVVEELGDDGNTAAR
jgi:hypothetical protein